MSAQLRVRGLGHRYGTSWVFADLDLDFGSGQTVALVGPSGSGKSTLLAALGGLLAPTLGAVSVTSDSGDESPIGDWTGAISWIFQTSNLLPRRTALENATMGGLSRGNTTAVATVRARHLLCELGLENLTDAQARKLSGGEAQRVGIARALAQAPDLLLADEPTGQLDERTTDEALAVLLSDSSDRVATVIATHDPNVARACDSRYRLEMGLLVREHG